MASCKIVEQEGLWLDVCTGGELHTALQAGFPTERLIVHGNNKSDEEITESLKARAALIVVDSLQELEVLNGLANDMGCRAEVMLRLSPGVEVDTHTHIRLGHVDTKFGLSLANGLAMEGVKQALALPNLNLRGVHCHIGSQILELRPFRETVGLMVEFMAQVKTETGRELEDLNLGGGLGSHYLSEEPPPSVNKYAEAITDVLRAALIHHGLKEVRLFQEPGRSLVAEAGTTLYTVGVIKDIPGVRKYVSVDGGLSDNPRPALYEAKYEAIVANKANLPAAEKVTIAGKHCETDLLIQDIDLPPLEPGDILAVQTTGAYNYSMASNYNRLPRPAVVLASGGQAEVIVERETLSDLVRADRIPPHLKDTRATG